MVNLFFFFTGKIFISVGSVRGVIIIVEVDKGHRLTLKLTGWQIIKIDALQIIEGGGDLNLITKRSPPTSQKCWSGVCEVMSLHYGLAGTSFTADTVRNLSSPWQIKTMEHKHFKFIIHFHCAAFEEWNQTGDRRFKEASPRKEHKSLQ